LVVDRLRADLDRARRAPVDADQLALDVEALAPEVRRVARRPPRPPRIKCGKDRVLEVGHRQIVLPEPQRIAPSVTLEQLHARMARPADRVVGIDLTGSDSRPSGWALVEGNLAVTGMLASFDDLVRATLAVKPRLVSIDSPLSLPTGRDCTDDGCECRAVGGITRHCERELKRRGINVYPCLIQSMQALTRRGIELAAALREQGIEVIESYPGAAQDIMRIPRKRASQEQLRAGLERFGFRGIRPAGLLTHDELDAITSAAVGLFYLADLFEPLGNADEDYLIIPSLKSLPERAGERRDAAPADARLYVVSSRPELVQRVLRRGSVTIGDWDGYWQRAAEGGARLRLARVLEAGVRTPRRPPFGDVWVREDDPQLTRRLRRWARDWLD
jgi:predicted nuclease with RNAse H fold